MTSNRGRMQVSVGLYSDVTMTRNVYLALILSCFLVGAVVGASVVGLVWLS